MWLEAVHLPQTAWFLMRINSYPVIPQLIKMYWYPYVFEKRFNTLALVSVEERGIRFFWHFLAAVSWLFCKKQKQQKKKNPKMLNTVTSCNVFFSFLNIKKKLLYKIWEHSLEFYVYRKNGNTFPFIFLLPIQLFCVN